MRNDDYEAVEALKRALRSAENEIAELEREARAMQDTLSKTLHELQELQSPTHMGEPVINTDYEDARRWRAVRRRHSVKLCKIATGSDSYSSTKAGSILDQWADDALAEIFAD